MEDVSQDIPRKRQRNSVENTTGVPSNQSNEDPSVTLGSLEEETNRIPLATKEDVKNLMENTNSGREQSEHRMSISPVIATLGTSPKKHNNALRGVTSPMILPREYNNNNILMRGVDPRPNEAENEDRDRAAEAERVIDRDIVAEIAEEKYIKTYARKEYYKRKTEEMENKVTNMEKDIKKEREREINEKNILKMELQGWIDHNKAMREKTQITEEKLGKMKRAHETNIVVIMEEHAVQNELEVRKRVRAEERIAELEMEMKKDRSNYYRLMRTRDNELATAQRKKEDDESDIVERERINKNLWDIINSQREEMEIKDIEIKAYKDHNRYISTPNPYHNGGRFSPDLRRQEKGIDNTNANFIPITNPRPRNQSTKDIKGRRENQQTRNDQIWEQEAWEDYQYREQSWDQPWDQQKSYRPQQQYSKFPRETQNGMQQIKERDQKDFRDRGRDRGNQGQEYDHWEPKRSNITKGHVDRRINKYLDDRIRNDLEPRYRETPRSRRGEREQRERSMSPRRQRERSPSPMNIGRGRGEEQRERDYDIWSNNVRGRREGFERRGEDASHGGR